MIRISILFSLLLLSLSAFALDDYVRFPDGRKALLEVRWGTDDIELIPQRIRIYTGSEGDNDENERSLTLAGAFICGRKDDGLYGNPEHFLDIRARNVQCVIVYHWLIDNEVYWRDDIIKGCDLW